MILNVEDSCISKPLACRLSVRASTSDVQAVFFWGLNMENFDRLAYDPETGVFIWKYSHANNVRDGDIAGHLNKKGYFEIGYNNKFYRAHRIAWFIFYGEWPAGNIDHINGIRSDNRIENLRDVTNAVNAQNQHKARSNNKIGLLGVHWNKRAKKWQSTICIDGKNVYIGVFSDKNKAYEAYLLKKRQSHIGCAI